MPSALPPVAGPAWKPPSSIPWAPILGLVVALAALAVSLFVAASRNPTQALAGGLVWRQVLVLVASLACGLAVIVSACLIRHIAGLFDAAMRVALSGRVPECDSSLLLTAHSTNNDNTGDGGVTKAVAACRFCRSKRVWETRYMARLMLLVPLYALVVLPMMLCMRVEMAAVSDQVKNTVEAFVAYTFWSLMMLYGGGYGRMMLDWPRYFLLDGETVSELTHTRHTALLSSSPHAKSTTTVSARDRDWAVGCRWCRDGDDPPRLTVDGDDGAADAATQKLLHKAFWKDSIRRWMAKRSLAVVIGRWLAVLYLAGNLLMLPIVVVCGCVSSSDHGWIWNDHGGTVIDPHRPMYLPGYASFKASMYPYVFQARCTLLTPSLVIIIWGIGTLSRTVMHVKKALPSKFVTVKAVVFLGVWQQLAIALCRKVGALEQFDKVSLASPTAYPAVDVSSTHYGVAITEVLIDGVLCCFEMLPIAIVSCFVFNGSTLTWPITNDGDPHHHHRDSIQPQSPATALEADDFVADKSTPVMDTAADEEHQLFVRRNLGGTGLWYMGDLVHDLLNVWSWRYEMPAARGIIA